MSNMLGDVLFHQGNLIGWCFDLIVCRGGIGAIKIVFVMAFCSPTMFSSVTVSSKLNGGAGGELIGV